MNPQPIPEDYEHRSIWRRLKDTFYGGDELEDEEPAPDPGRRPGQAIRLHSARSGRVAVRMNAQGFEDARAAADGLKSGEHQVINLERATPQMGERIIDFLNGVCYALDGTVERVGEKVYMFVPANVHVDVDAGSSPNGRKAQSAFE